MTAEQAKAYHRQLGVIRELEQRSQRLTAGRNAAPSTAIARACAADAYVVDMQLTAAYRTLRDLGGR